MKEDTYAQAANSLAWLLGPIEDHLRNAPATTNVDSMWVATLGIKRIFSSEQLSACFSALHAAGVLIKGKWGYRITQEHPREKLARCRGIREGIAWCATLETDSVDLCIALPPGVPAEVEKQFRSQTVDMRASIVNLISSAKERIILVSPFWDEETSNDLSELVGRRLDAGVSVEIVGRFDLNDSALAIIRHNLKTRGSYRIFRWSIPLSDDRFGTQTFHFKSIAVDNGKCAYVGSANFTTGGLRSRMELGVILRGPTARRLQVCLDEVLLLAESI